MHLEQLSRAWVVRVTAASVIALGVAGVIGAVAEQGPERSTILVTDAAHVGSPDEAAGPDPAAMTAAARALDPSVGGPAPADPPPTTAATPPPTSPPTTVAPALPTSSSTTTAQRPVTATTVRPTGSTTTPPATATYYVTNSTASTELLMINDVTHRVLPGQVIGPFTTVPRTNGVAGGDVGSVSLEADPTCGAGDSDHYFDPGSTFDVLISETPSYCSGPAAVHAPNFTVRGRLPRSG